MRGIRTIKGLSVLVTVGALASSTLGTGAALASGPQSWDTTSPLEVTTRHYVIDRPTEKVRERIGIHLDTPADVDVTVYPRHPTSVIRGTVHLGRLAAGQHYWTWNGYDNGHHQASDGLYSVSVAATLPNQHIWPATTSARVNRRYDPGTLTSNYATIYPRSTAVHDRTRLTTTTPEPIKGTLRIRNAAGYVVFTRTYPKLHTVRHTDWDGRDRHGRAVRPGTYYTRVSGSDVDGLRGATKRIVLHVSARRLVRATRTVTAAPADVVAPPCSNGQGMSCGLLTPCGTITASDRFPQAGALSYRSAEDCDDASALDHGALSRDQVIGLHQNAPRGYGTMTVSMFGGPTTPGAPDQGTLSATSSTGKPVTVSPGADSSDHTMRLPPVPVGDVATGIDTAVPALIWRFTTDNGDSYDVASYTVTYNFLTPRA